MASKRAFESDSTEGTAKRTCIQANRISWPDLCALLCKVVLSTKTQEIIDGVVLGAKDTSYNKYASILFKKLGANRTMGTKDLFRESDVKYDEDHWFNILAYLNDHRQPTFNRRIFDAIETFLKVCAFLDGIDVLPRISFKSLKNLESMKEWKQRLQRPLHLYGSKHLQYAEARLIANNLGFPQDHTDRIRAVVVFCTRSSGSSEGSTCCIENAFFAAQLESNGGPGYKEWYKNTICSTALRKKDFPWEETHWGCDDLAITRIVRAGIIKVFESKVYREEIQLAQMIHQKCSEAAAEAAAEGAAEAAAEGDSSEGRLSLDPEQAAAVRMALTKRLCIVYGKAGTGKTNVQKTIIDEYKRNSKVIRLAPTGKAASRMAQVIPVGVPLYVGLEKPRTMHSFNATLRSMKAWESERRKSHLCGDPKCSEEHVPCRQNDDAYSSDGTTCSELHDFLDGALLIVDEFSMVSMHLFYKFMKGIESTSCSIVLMGDHNQLPSIECGAVLRDMLSIDAIPKVELKTCHRQEERAGPLTYANSLLKGTFYDAASGYQYTSREALIAEALRSSSRFTLQDFKEGKVVALGCTRKVLGPLNEQLRLRFNDTPANKYGMGVGDPVICIVNIYKQKKKKPLAGPCGGNIRDCNVEGLQVCNGESGVIIDAKLGKKHLFDFSITVRFENNHVHSFEGSDCSMLQLAYALTIHKAQGAEYPHGLCILDNWHEYCYGCQLYTGITRFKESVQLLGLPDSLKAMCDPRQYHRKTRTNLQEALAHLLAKMT